MIFAVILSCIFILINYLFYPVIIIYLSNKKASATSENISNIIYHSFDIIIPLHNEEKVIEAKINSILQSDYPIQNINLHFGLDNCIDNSINIINKYINNINIINYNYNKRIGKPNILNDLVNKIKANSEIILFTDADILFEKNTIKNINLAMQNKSIGIVDVCIKNRLHSNIEENTYNNFENKLKYAESNLFNLFQGVSGACYAIRSQYFQQIPNNFLVDDYFISMNVFLKKGKGKFLNNTYVFEQKNTTLTQEFKRKIRIASGSFQNAWYFKSLLLNLHKPLGYTFFFHKILRWLTPIFLIIIGVYLIINYTFIIFVLTLVFTLLAYLLFIFDVKNNPIKIFIYFIIMNVAIFIGLIKFLKGIKTNIWQPTTK